MTSSDSSAEMFAWPKTSNPTSGLQQEAMKPGITISLLEIGSLSPFYSLKHNDHLASEPQMTQTLCDLLKDIKDMLKDVAGFEKKTTEENKSFEDSNSSESVSELKGLDQVDKTQLKKLPVSLDPDKEQNTKEQKIILKAQNPKNMVQVPSRYVGNSRDRRAFSETQLAAKKRRYEAFYVQEENRRLRNNMEQLLQEADHWSRQHTELSALIKSYQESQRERRESLENHQVTPCDQPHNEGSSAQELEEQARKLTHDTQSLRLIAALLQNECQILQQRVEILKTFHHHQEKPTQVNHEEDKRNEKPVEPDKVEPNKNRQVSEGAFLKRDKGCKNSDACLRKKARKNWLNARIARKALIGKRRFSSSLR